MKSKKLTNVPPTYRRQRLLLYFLEFAGKSLSKVDLQKLLLLYSKECDSQHYDFVPFRFGAYSFLCQSDLELLVQRGWIAETRNKRIALSVKIKDTLWASCSEERVHVQHWLSRNRLRGNKLVAESYRRHPYYAIHSEMQERLLNAEELEMVQKHIPRQIDNAVRVFTLGYEGIHFETYLNKLIQNNVRVLLDVRKNPHSRKFGFSGKMLKDVLGKLGIKYMHFPELGVASDKRRNLNNLGSYKSLFASYRMGLPRKQAALRDLVAAIRKYRKVALTCFEADWEQCHRHCLSDLVRKEYGFGVEHL